MARTRWPVDLLAVALATGGAVLAVLLDAPIAVKAFVGIPLVLFLPGYAVLAVTHPGVGADEPGRKHVRSLANVDRLILSFALSVIVALLVGATLSFVPLGLTAASSVLALAGTTLLAAALALVVRLADTPSDRRPAFGWRSRPVPWHEWLSLLGVAVGVVVLALAATRLASSIGDDGYVSLFVEPNFVVDCYPLRYDGTNYTYGSAGGTRCVGSPSNITLVLNNHQDQAIDYTLRILWSEFSGVEDTDGLLAEESTGRLDPLPPGDRLARQHTQPLLTEPPPFNGGQYLKVHLFLGEPDDTPDHALQIRVQNNA